MPWYYLTERDVMTVLAAAGQGVQLRDFGLLSAAVARPRASAFGEDAYQDPWVKAAALLHSLTRNHAFEDGNADILNVDHSIAHMQLVNTPSDDAVDVDRHVIAGLDPRCRELIDDILHRDIAQRCDGNGRDEAQAWAFRFPVGPAEQ